MESGAILYQISAADLDALAAKLLDGYKAATEQQTQPEPEEAPGPRFYSRQQLKDMLGVSMPTIHALLNNGALRYTKIGSRTLIFADYADEQIKAGKLAKYQRRTGK